MDEYMPISPKMRSKVHPDMVVVHDFGPPKGRCWSISHRDFLLFCGTTEETMRKVDAERKAKGMPPAFDDDAMNLRPLR
jgi:hypothetical protein